MFTTAELCQLSFGGGWPMGSHLYGIMGLVLIIAWWIYVSDTPETLKGITDDVLEFITSHRNKKERPQKMHFSYLPDELIAHIASCLNYSDVYNLMQTSKKNYNAIKKYKIDKIRLQTLQFGYSLSEKFTLEAIDSSGKKYSYKNWDETKVDANEVEKVLSKCASIDNLSVYLPNIFEIEFFNIIMDAKTCIRTIEIDCERTNISVDKLLRLGQKSIVHFIFRDDVDDAMLNDEVLLKIFPGSIRKSCSRIAGNVVSPMPITNRILQSLLGKTELPKRFRLDHVHNFITVNEVVKTVNILHERSIDTGIYWELGILQPSQAADAARYFGINGEMKGTCYVSKNGGNSYYVEDRAFKFTISFAVASP